VIESSRATQELLVAVTRCLVFIPVLTFPVSVAACRNLKRQTPAPRLFCYGFRFGFRYGSEKLGRNGLSWILDWDRKSLERVGEKWWPETVYQLVLHLLVVLNNVFKLGFENDIKEAIRIMLAITERDIKRHLNEAEVKQAGQIIQFINKEKG
jgi:hypothetical protein